MMILANNPLNSAPNMNHDERHRSWRVDYYSIYQYTWRDACDGHASLPALTILTTSIDLAKSKNCAKRDACIHQDDVSPMIACMYSKHY